MLLDVYGSAVVGVAIIQPFVSQNSPFEIDLVYVTLSIAFSAAENN